MRISTVKILVALAHICPKTFGFSGRTMNRLGSSPGTAVVRTNYQALTGNRLAKAMQLNAKDTNKDTLEGQEREAAIGGTDRGLILMGIVLSICVWIFSIPPEFRRAKICSAEQSAVYEECQTFTQWTDGVGDYYKNGGGVHFDFSIDPATLEKNGFL